MADCVAIRLFCVVGRERAHKKYIKFHKPLALKLTLSRIIQVSNNLHFYERRGVIIMKYMDKDDFEKQNVFGTGQANTAYAKYFIGDSFL